MSPFVALKYSYMNSLLGIKRVIFDGEVGNCTVGSDKLFIIDSYLNSASAVDRSDMERISMNSDIQINIIPRAFALGSKDNSIPMAIDSAFRDSPKLIEFNEESNSVIGFNLNQQVANGLLHQTG